MLNTTEKINFSQEIEILKRKKNAVVLAHYYQRPEIQDLADFVGDSLALAKKAANSKADLIVFCGVHFMAETAKILNPTKKVLLPDLSAGCSLSDSCDPQSFKALREKNPDHIAVTYINCSAEIKALSDIICTSSNAKQIIQSIPKNQPILFAPDKNLGNYLIKETGRKILLWEGECIVHTAFSFNKLLRLHLQYLEAVLVAHPESESNILDLAKFVGSTSAMIEFIKSSNDESFLVATEIGIINELQKQAPHKKIIPVPTTENNSCACSECAYMKVNTIEKLYQCLLQESPEIILHPHLIKQASIPLKKMINI